MIRFFIARAPVALLHHVTYFVVGQAILPAAAFQAAPSGHVRVFALDKRRQSAG
jgi:hypothetical protein